MRARFVGSFLALLCLSSVCACGSEPRPLPEWPTPVPPNYRLVQGEGWEDLEIRTLCTTVDQIYDLRDGRVSPLPGRDHIRDIIQGTLDILKVRSVAAGSTCDASLTVEARFVAISASYIAGGTRYTGAGLNLFVTLAAPERPTLTWRNTKTEEPATSVRGDSYRVPEDAPFHKVWPEPLSDTILSMFGDSGYCPVLVTVWEGYVGGPNSLVWGGLDWDRAATAVPCLVELLRSPDASIRLDAADRLGWLSSGAKGAVPYLLQLHVDEQEESYVRYAAGQALRKITGVGKEPDSDGNPYVGEYWSAEKWIKWWNAQDPGDWAF